MYLFLALYEVGGYEGMVNQYMVSAANRTVLQETLFDNGSCGFVPDDSLKIFRGLDSDYPWPGLVFGLTLLATYFFCTNQVCYTSFVPQISFKIPDFKYFVSVLL